MKYKINVAINDTDVIYGNYYRYYQNINIIAMCQYMCINASVRQLISRVLINEINC